MKIILIAVGVIAVVGFVLYRKANAANAAAKRQQLAKDLKKSYDSAAGLSKCALMTLKCLLDKVLKQIAAEKASGELQESIE